MDVLRKVDNGLLGIIQFEIYFLRRLKMKKLILLLVLFSVCGCSNVFVAGDWRKERKELYDYNNDAKYCQENPDRCVNNVPW